jgi:hypothetical protein
MVGAAPLNCRYSFSVGVNGKPRSPWKSFFNRRSFELVFLRRMPGAINLLVSRRARRPRNQSSQLMGRSMGIEGTFDLEFIGDFVDERFTLLTIAIFRTSRNPAYLRPVYLDLSP